MTKSAAREALDVLPDFLPILHRSDRGYWYDGAIGRVYALDGQGAVAIPYYERAIASCDALEDLVIFVRVESEFADLLAREGNTLRACDLYERVLMTWSPASGSATAQHAASQVRQICPGFINKERP
jgi:tetratricopeptide (TPR) repeat protein